MFIVHDAINLAAAADFISSMTFATVRMFCVVLVVIMLLVVLVMLLLMVPVGDAI